MPTFKEFLEKVLGVKTRVIRKRIIEEKHIKDLDKAFEENRGYLQGELAREKVKSLELQEQIKPKEIDITRELGETQRTLERKPFEGAFSLKKFFKEYLKKDNWKKYGTYSHNFKRKFGIFDDLLILKDGRLAIVTKRDGESRPLIAGKTVKHILTNFRGLTESASRGFFLINLDERGRFVDNLLETEVPNIILDSNGKFIFTRENPKPFTERLAKKDAELSELYEQVEFDSVILSNTLSDLRKEKLHSKFNKERAETAQSMLTQEMDSVMKIHKDYGRLARENVKLADAGKLAEKRADELDEVIEEIRGKLAEKKSKTEIEEALDQIKDTSMFLRDIGEAFIIPVQKEEKKPSLEKKYEE